MATPPLDLVLATKDIVAAYVAHNSLPEDKVPTFIEAIYGSLTKISGKAVVTEATEPVTQEPAVPIRKSVTPEYLICLEDGKRLKVMTRYLRTKFGMSPEEYRRKWGLPHDYPMTAPGYSEKRSRMAHEMGLGKQRKKVVARGKSAPRTETLSKEA